MRRLTEYSTPIVCLTPCYPYASARRKHKSDSGMRLAHFCDRLCPVLRRLPTANLRSIPPSFLLKVATPFATFNSYSANAMRTPFFDISRNLRPRPKRRRVFAYLRPHALRHLDAP